MPLSKCVILERDYLLQYISSQNCNQGELRSHTTLSLNRMKQLSHIKQLDEWGDPFLLTPHFWLIWSMILICFCHPQTLTSYGQETTRCEWRKSKGVFGSINEVVYFFSHLAFFIRFVEWNELIHRHLIHHKLIISICMRNELIPSKFVGWTNVTLPYEVWGGFTNQTQPCLLELLQQYFLANEKYFSLTTNQHKPNFSETNGAKKISVECQMTCGWWTIDTCL
jgi:hypothetical protein